MRTGPTRTKRLSEKEVDNFVVAEAENDAVWEPQIKVKPSSGTSFSLPRDLAARASFLARIHHMERVGEWITQVIRERIELEEVAFAEAKREISGRSRIQPAAAPDRATRRR
ncbi:MAG TPA: hypothetical protein VGS07_21630 [Thermoanaerobaculia bacterium]|nr:hypothetical protein [Thermoanaerobaculia bacterium]